MSEATPPLGTVDEKSGLRWWKYGDDYYVSLDRERLLYLAFRDLRRGRDGGGLIAQVEVTEAGQDFNWSLVTLGSDPSRSVYVRGAKGAITTEQMRAACRLIDRLYRVGEPAAPLVAREPTADEWFMPQWIPRRNSTVFYGDGGAHKSRLAMALAVCGLHKRQLPGWPVEPITGGVLYLDWETNRQTHEYRLWRFLRPANLPDSPRLIYRRMTMPLGEDIRALRVEVDQRGIELVIVDSFAQASGGESEGWSDMSVRTFDALHTLDTTNLVISHIPKGAANGSDIPPPWGSIYNQNIPRSTIFCAKTDTDDRHVKLVTATHRKSNEGALMDPVGFRFVYDADGNWVIQAAEADDSHASPMVKIFNALRRGETTVTGVSVSAGLDAVLVRVYLNRAQSRNLVVNRSVTPGGRGKEGEWYLVDRKRDNGSQ